MPAQSTHSFVPLAFQQLQSAPLLYSQVAAAVEAQQALIDANITAAIPRPELLAQIEDRIQTMQSGVLAIRAATGSGLSTLLCQLAVAHPYALWLPACSGADGYEALCAQIIALQRHPVALLPPAARRDATTLERLLAELTAEDRPIVMIIDTRSDALIDPLPAPFPSVLPDGILLIAGCSLDETLPLPIDQTMMLAPEQPTLVAELLQLANSRGCDAEQAQNIVAHSQNSWLYVQLACGLLHSPAWPAQAALPNGLDAVHAAWWRLSNTKQRWILQLLAAAEQPIEPAELAALTQLTMQEFEQQIGMLAPLLVQYKSGLALLHYATRMAIVRAAGGLEHAHAALANMQLAGEESASRASHSFIIHRTARHIALSDLATRLAHGQLPETRAWIMNQERQTGTMRAAAQEQQWSLYTAASDGPLLRLVRSAVLAGTLTLRARLLPRESAAVLHTAMAGGAQREPVLSRLRTLLAQLPAGREKANMLRSFGEACYALGMRAPAMRMLSEALDLEVQGLPRSWHDEREELLVALSRAAIAHGWHNTALGITTLITHAERRGMMDTEVVRALINARQLTRAEEVAYAIAHPSAHDWAMAEVAVGHARAGDQERATIIQETLRAPTTIAWAVTELASDAAQQGQPDAIQSALQISQPMLRDRALAQVTQGLAEQQLMIEAFAATTSISNAEIRVRTLIAIANINAEAAPVALAGAARLLDRIEEATRSSMIAHLAAAYASISRTEHAHELLLQLPPGEERDRAQARMASTLMRRGMMSEALNIARAITDPDERSWALDDLARLMVQRAIWQPAFDLVMEIDDHSQRERSEGDLIIAWARSGYPEQAQARALAMTSTVERLRALIAITEPLASFAEPEAMHRPLALLTDPDQRSRYQAAGSAALAAQGYYEAAQNLAVMIVRPYERARAFAALARALAIKGHRDQAQSALGLALREAAWLGRVETLTCLAWSAETLALLGGDDLLLSVASVLDELDTWWNS